MLEDPNHCEVLLKSTWSQKVAGIPIMAGSSLHVRVKILLLVQILDVRVPAIVGLPLGST